MVRISFTSFSVFKGIDYILNVLHRVSIGHHHCIGRFNHYQIAYARGRHQTRLTAHIAVVSVIKNDITVRHIPCAIFTARVPQRGPRTNITPVTIQRHNSTVCRVLHHRAVNTFRRTSGKGRRIRPNKVHIVFGVCHSHAASGRNRGLELGQRVQKVACLKQEHAAVPNVLPRVDVAFSGGRVGLLNELIEHCYVPRQCLATLYIPVTRLRAGGH